MSKTTLNNISCICISEMLELIKKEKENEEYENMCEDARKQQNQEITYLIYQKMEERRNRNYSALLHNSNRLPRMNPMEYFYMMEERRDKILSQSNQYIMRN